MKNKFCELKILRKMSHNCYIIKLLFYKKVKKGCQARSSTKKKIVAQ